eukprot:gene30009-51164_t
MKLFQSSIILCFIGFAIIVVSVFVLSMLLSTPLISVSQASSAMVAGIGGD